MGISTSRLLCAVAAVGFCLVSGCLQKDSASSSPLIDPCQLDQCVPASVCGDAVCDADETCSSCPEDCGICFDPDIINVSGVPDLQPMSTLYDRAQTLGVSPPIAGVPNIDTFLQNPPPTAFDYPIGAASLQDFMNRLFQNGIWANTAPGQSTTPLPPDANGCELVHVNAQYNPQELVSFDAGAGLLFPGSLEQGAYVNLGAGSLAPIHVPYTQRNPVHLVTTFYDTRTATTATSTDVYTAIGEMIRDGNLQGDFLQSTAYFDIVSASTLEEAATKLKLDVKLLGANIGATFSTSTSTQSNSVFVRYQQSLFTVFQDLQGYTPTAAELNSSTLAVSDLEALGNTGELAYNNLPTYTRAVTYGRLLLFSVTSNVSKSELEAAANAIFGKNSASATTSQKAIIQNSEIRLFGYGGPSDPQISAIRSGRWEDYFTLSDVPIGTLKPLGYEVRRFDDQLATMSRATEYTERTCPPLAHTITVQMSDTYKQGTLSIWPSGAAGYQQILQTTNGFASMNINPYMTSSDDQIKVAVQVGSTDIFNPSHAHITLTIYVDGVQRAQVSWSCSSCHSRDPVWTYRVNQFTGEVTQLSAP